MHKKLKYVYIVHTCVFVKKSYFGGHLGCDFLSLSQKTIICVRYNNTCLSNIAFLFILRGTLFNSRRIFIIFWHLGRHLEFLKMLNDDRLSSSRIVNGNVYPTRICKEKNFIPQFQVKLILCRTKPWFSVFKHLMDHEEGV